MGLFPYIKQRIISSLSSRMEYRGNFILFLLLSMVMNLMPVFMTYAVYNITNGIEGWSYYEILFLISTYYIVISTVNLFFHGTIDFPRKIKDGSLDNILTLPLNPLLTFFGFEIHEIGGLVSGLLILGLSLPNLNIQFSFFRLFFMIVFLLIGVVSAAVIRLLSAVIALFTVENNAITNSLNDIRERFSKWPLTVYPDYITVFLTFIYPVAFIAFVPSSFMLGKDVPLQFWFSPVIVGILAYLVIRLFNYGLSKYSSAGG